MERNFEYKITKEEEGLTICDFLKKQGYSHAVIVQLKKTKESVLLNGTWAYMNYRLASNDVLFIHLEECLMGVAA